VDTIVDVARNKAAPLADLGSPESEPDPASAGTNAPRRRRLHQVLLYMRCLHLLSQTLAFSRAELRSKRLKPSAAVKKGETL